MDNSGFYDFLKQEAKVILQTAAPIILSLYVKRSIDKLIGSHVVNEKLVRTGMQGMPTPSSVPVTVAPPAPTAVFREGPGSKYVPGHGRVYYSAHYRTSDGYDLYSHSDEMHMRQEVSCPLLYTDHGCNDCRFHVEKSIYTWQSGCSAAVWLEECKSQEIGLERFQSSML